MRFPAFTLLDEEQKRIFVGAPPCASILVIGPPGTGKTVMAFHRAEMLKLLSQKKTDFSACVPSVIMYSKVLSAYSQERGDVAAGVACSTMHRWVWDWFREVAGNKPPTLPNDPYAHDWMAIFQSAMNAMSAQNAKVHWGHLIIDEGQDFPIDMYAALGALCRLYKPSHSEKPPALCVFADDNQRLDEKRHSTTAQIQEALGLGPGHVMFLSRNHRNSKQVAAFARHYFVGLASGIPKDPTRLGKTLPRVKAQANYAEACQRIRVYAANNPGNDIGVLCPNNQVREKLFGDLRQALSNRGMIVQTYSSSDQQAHPATALQFDTGKSVTVLNFKSAKGLEFDAVFIIDPFRGGGGTMDEFSKMEMYVMTSRAREYLEVIVLNPPTNLAALLPPEEFYERV